MQYNDERFSTTLPAAIMGTTQPFKCQATAPRTGTAQLWEQDTGPKIPRFPLNSSMGCLIIYLAPFGFNWLQLFSLPADDGCLSLDAFVSTFIVCCSHCAGLTSSACVSPWILPIFFSFLFLNQIVGASAFCFSPHTCKQTNKHRHANCS